MAQPIVTIKNTFLRRAAMIACAPAGFIYLLPTFALILWSALGGAVDGFVEEWRW